MSSTAVDAPSLQWRAHSATLSHVPMHNCCVKMGRDGVPLDEVSNPMSRTSHLKRQRQHSRKKPAQTHVLTSDVNARTQGQSWETRETSHLPKGDSGRTQMCPFARHALVNSFVHRSCTPKPRQMRPHWEFVTARNHSV